MTLKSKQRMTMIENNDSTNNRTNDERTKSGSDAAEDSIEASQYWDRLPGEPSKAYHAFCLYLRGGHWRSIRKVADVLGRGVSYESQLEKLSVKFKWFERAQAFDTYVDELQTRQHLAELQATYERHIEHARLLEEKAFDELMSRDLKKLKPSELIKLHDIASRTERVTWALKSEVGNKISDTYASSRLRPPLKVIKQVRQDLKEAGILAEIPEIASEQIFQVLQQL